MSNLKIGDICLWSDPQYHLELGTHEVIIRGEGYEGYEFTVETTHPTPVKYTFHRCHSGPIVFQSERGRWVNGSELTLLKPSIREPSRFGKFIQKIEGK